MVECQRGDEELSTVVTPLIKCHHSVRSIGLSRRSQVSELYVLAKVFFLTPKMVLPSAPLTSFFPAPSLLFFLSLIYSVLSPFQGASRSISSSYPLFPSVSTIPLPSLSAACPPASYSAF